MKRTVLLTALLSVSLLTRSYLIPQTYAYVLTTVVYAILVVWALNLNKTKLLNARAPLYAALTIFMIYTFHLLLSVISGQGVFTTALRSTIFIGFAALNLFVLPNYYKRESFIRIVSRFGAVVVAIGLPTAIFGDYSLFGITVQAWPWHLPVTLPFLSKGFLHPMQSVTNNPNVVGLLASVATICSASELLRRCMWTKSALLLCNLTGVVLSGSRAALLAVTAGGTLLMLWQVGGVRVLRRTTMLGAVGWAVFVGLIAGILPLHEVISSLDFRGRTVLWNGAIEALSTRPLLGFGPGDRAAFIRPFVIEEWHGYTPHNSYLRMYLTTGIVGGMAYVYFTLAAIFGSIQEGVTSETVALGVVAVVAAIMQTFSGFSLFGLSFNSVLIALVFGFAAHPAERLSNRFTTDK